MGNPALIDVLARDGSVQHTLKVNAWPVTVGRDLGCDLVLDDPHTAAHHFTVETGEDGEVFVTAGESLNGIEVDGHRLRSGERRKADQPQTPLLAGRTHLRLRIGGHPLPPEIPLQAAHSLAQGAWSLPVLLVLAALVFGFDKYLVVSPDDLSSALTSRFIGLAGVSLAWCGAWTLLSKIFNHRGHFLWHLRVLLCASLVWLAIDTTSAVLAFSMSWPWASDFDFVAKLFASASALYFHLQAVEPHHRRLTRGLAICAWVLGVSWNLWNNWQNSSRFGAELYMNHLFPPAARLATPVNIDTFMERTRLLEKTLDNNATKEPEEEPAEDDKP